MRMILARLTIFWGVFPSAISRCSWRRAFRSSTNRNSLYSIREVNHYHTKDSNVYDTTLAYARSICGCRSRSCWGFGTAGVMIHAPRHEGERQRICGSDVVLRRRAVTWFLPGVAPKTLPATRRLHHPMKPRSPGGQKSVAVPNRAGDCSCDAGEAGISRRQT